MSVIIPSYFILFGWSSSMIMLRRSSRKQHHYMGRLETKTDFHIPIHYVLFQHYIALHDITRSTILNATVQKIDQINA
jgi:hypothetical protein